MAMGILGGDAVLKKAIVLASFGVSDSVARKRCIESIVKVIQGAFCDYEVRQAYTSDFIRKRLSAQGIEVPSLPAVLDELQEDGFDQVVIQPTHLTPGEEYDNKIVAVVAGRKKDFLQLLLGRPIFMTDGSEGTPDDYSIALKAILSSVGNVEKNEEIVLMGHGSPHRHNPVYEILQSRCDTKNLPVSIGVLEENDVPDFAAVWKRLKAKSCKSVLLVPLLVAGGMHVVKDMAGEASNSWKSRLQRSGFAVRIYVHGLGENEAFRQIYVQHCKDVIK
jgi:sirohydrochlorin cobaltochelatase